MRNVYKTIPEQRLRDLYINRKLSYRDIAKAYHCDLGVIARALQYHGIAARHPTQALKLDAVDLRRLYRGGNLSTYKIAAKYGCDPKTVYRYLKLNNIATRPRKRILLSRVTLCKLYTREKKSLETIARAHGYSAAGILKQLRRFRIERRTTSEMNVKHVKTDFGGDKNEKAYMIGFRIGDLAVRKSGNLVYINCGTTKKVQIKLIRDMFRAYGPIWIGQKQKTGAVNIGSALNRSFAFLLPKYRRIPQWIMRVRSTFFSFLAGYTDAEGNISISQGRAKFRLRSYDKGILHDIHCGLRQRGIHSLFGLALPAGVYGRGVKHNGDCWFVITNRKESLFKLFMILLPLLRHGKRKRDAETANANVTLRLAR